MLNYAAGSMAKATAAAAAKVGVAACSKLPAAPRLGPCADPHGLDDLPPLLLPSCLDEAEVRRCWAPRISAQTPPSALLDQLEPLELPPLELPEAMLGFDEPVLPAYGTLAAEEPEHFVLPPKAPRLRPLSPPRRLDLALPKLLLPESEASHAELSKTLSSPASSKLSPPNAPRMGPRAAPHAPRTGPRAPPPALDLLPPLVLPEALLPDDVVLPARVEVVGSNKEKKPAEASPPRSPRHRPRLVSGSTMAGDAWDMESMVAFTLDGFTSDEDRSSADRSDSEWPKYSPEVLAVRAAGQPGVATRNLGSLCTQQAELFLDGSPCASPCPSDFDAMVRISSACSTRDNTPTKQRNKSISRTKAAEGFCAPVALSS